MSESFKSLEEMINEANSFTRSTFSEDLHDFLDRLSTTLQTHELINKKDLPPRPKELQ